MSAAFEELLSLLDERDIGYSASDDQSIRTDLRGDVAAYRIVARVDDQYDLFQVFGYCPLHVPHGCRPAVAEAIARANYGLRLGKFELDLDDGELRFHIAQMLAYGMIGEEVIDRMIGAAVNMLDMYLPAFLSVVYANEPPSAAIERVEVWANKPGQFDDDDLNDDALGAEELED
ncbi:MAG: YbjN domain-containing protein [Pirellulaceae bacterium]|jgi:hypothetical protein|nr:YbjN domain-containing protein [Pirellulaceae bacterium]